MQVWETVTLVTGGFQSEVQPITLMVVIMTPGLSPELGEPDFPVQVDQRHEDADRVRCRGLGERGERGVPGLGWGRGRSAEA